MMAGGAGRGSWRGIRIKQYNKDLILEVGGWEAVPMWGKGGDVGVQWGDNCTQIPHPEVIPLLPSLLTPQLGLPHKI